MASRAPAFPGLCRRGWPHVLVGGWALLGCGPSFEILAEGDLRFAHCDRLDVDPEIAPSHRLHCWREWRRMYTYGQTRDRVEYAQRRIAEVVSGDTDPPFLLPTSKNPARPAGPGAPSRGEPPELLRPLVPVPSPLGAAPAQSSAPPAVDPACRSRCENARAACSPGCETRPTGCIPCEQPLEACLEDCQAASPRATPGLAP